MKLVMKWEISDTSKEINKRIIERFNKTKCKCILPKKLGKNLDL